jgi:hypothetical protein
MRARTCLLALSFAVACGGQPAAIKAPAEPAPSASASAVPAPLVLAAPEEPALPVQKTGRLEPVVHAQPLTAHVEGRLASGAWELLQIDWPREIDEACHRGPSCDGAVVRVKNAEGVVVPGEAPSSGDKFFVRRPKTAAGLPLKLAWYGPAYSHAKPSFGEAFTIAVAGTDGPTKPDLDVLFVGALERVFAGRSGAFYGFANERLGELLPKGKPEAPRASRARPSKTSAKDAAREAAMRAAVEHDQREYALSSLMDVLTGVSSVQEAIEPHRKLVLSFAREPKNLPLDRVPAPRLERHPWGAMTRALGRSAPAEPLASSAPAEFWYVRSRTLTAVLDLLDQASLWIEPAARVLDRHSEDHGLAGRYETALGIERGPLTRALGPQVVSELAAVGSDPYFREGTDLTLLFRVKIAPAFDAAMAAALANRCQGHGAPVEGSFPAGAATVRSYRTADGAVTSYRAKVGDLAIVSNSDGAIRRVLATVARQHPALVAEPDFAYMLARDAGTDADVLAFFGDRFVGEVIGPAQRIAEARRQIALTELFTPGYASLLYGWMYGTSPKTLNELIVSKLLGPAELKHADGTAIAWAPGQAARSPWGTPGSLTPLIDMPAVTAVSAIEQAAYKRFAQGYESRWSRYVDPIAVRLSGGAAHWRVDLRFLPFSNARDLRELAEMVGKERVSVPALADGVRAVLAIGADARLRREADSMVHGFAKKLGIGWLGDWVMLGALDSTRLATAAADSPLVRHLPQLDHENDRRPFSRELFDVPLYAAIAIRDRTAAAIALSVVREQTRDFIKWESLGSYRGIAIGRIGASEAKDDVEGYYALCPSALYVSLQQAALTRLVDAELDGKAPSHGGDAQLALDLRTAPGKGLFTVLAWLLEAELGATHQDARRAAEAVLRGSPEARTDPAVARALVGAAPLTPDGRPYLWADDGVTDPDWGSAHAPVLPALPVKGGSVEKLLSVIRGARSEVAFDDEPGGAGGAPDRSLRIRLELDVAAPP